MSFRYLMLSSSTWDEVKVVHKVKIVKKRMNNEENMVLRLKSCCIMIMFWFLEIGFSSCPLKNII